MNSRMFFKRLVLSAVTRTLIELTLIAEVNQNHKQEVKETLQTRKRYIHLRGARLASLSISHWLIKKKNEPTKRVPRLNLPPHWSRSCNKLFSSDNALCCYDGREQLTLKWGGRQRNLLPLLNTVCRRWRLLPHTKLSSAAVVPATETKVHVATAAAVPLPREQQRRRRGLPQRTVF